MKKLITAIITIILLVGIAGTAMAGRVGGYFRSNGTYVQPHYRSNPNGSVTDNYSFKGNSNPYTGREGSNYYRHSTSSPYYEGPSSPRW